MLLLVRVIHITFCEWQRTATGKDSAIRCGLLGAALLSKTARRYDALASARFFAFCIVDAAFSFTYSCGLLLSSILCNVFRKGFLLPHWVAVPYLCQHSPGFGEFTLCGHNTDGLRLLLRITRASSGGLNEVSERLHGKQRLISIKSAVVLCGRLLDAGEFGYR
ncbi:hypothetical protein Tsp_12445 [Trichinella spiralis]|uniref:hypothetical protein n=1 Tax=Trichinella spiralis TaxID=6334 RepID=UPI0001EFE027|nr:hypothetical protein Tsp_12445 [Trichinella spiralis]